MQKKLPIGIENFEDMIKENYYYVDKTGLLKQLLNEHGLVNLFTRPRRFGKSLNMSMLKYFFEIGNDQAIFEGLEISKDKELCDQYQGKFPVISVSLKGAKAGNYEDAKAMMKYFMTDNQVIHEEEKLQDGVWVRMISPTQEECEEIADVLNVDIDDIKAALDEEESSRIELQDGYTLILVDVPTTEIRHDKQSYTTIPLGIILTQDVIVTVCTEDTPVLKNFVINRVKEFSTKKRLRFVYQILYRTATIYQTNLRIIDKRRTEIEERIGQHTEDVDLIDLHELESTLVYFATSLRANGVVLDRLTRYKRLEQYPEDTELLGDVIVENQQAIEMTSIYRDIINGTRELMSSVIDNRLNNVMKYLTSITIVMAIPTVISGIYGMNVDERWMPFANTPHGFLLICVLTLLICIITMLILRKKKML